LLTKFQVSNNKKDIILLVYQFYKTIRKKPMTPKYSSLVGFRTTELLNCI